MRPSLGILLASVCLFWCASLVMSQDLDSLRTDVASGNVEVQRNALFQIRNLRSAEASRLAIAALSDRNEIVRATVAAAVVYLPPGEAVTVLLPLLRDKAEFVRQEAAFALGNVGDPSSVNALIRAVQNDKDPVKNAAVVSLGKIGDAAALDSLLTILKKKPTEDNEFVRRSAARSIGQIAQFQRTGRREVITPRNYLPTKFKEAAAAEPSSGLFGQAVPALINILKSDREADDTRREAAFALGAIGDSAAVPALRAFLKSPDNHLAEICKEALIKLGAFQ